jgi:uroporphyrinogen-III synthase
MGSLDGKRVALLEAHKVEEAAAQVRRLGGEPYSVPAMREVSHPDRVGAFIERLSARQLSLVSFLTGVGATALLEEARRLGRVDETLEGLRHTTTACRGPKPVAVLREHGIAAQIVAAEPYTSRQLIEALSGLAVTGKSAAVVRDGDPTGSHGHAVTRSLVERGAIVDELWLYEWAMPLDVEPLNTLVQQLSSGRVDAIAFTNRIQVRHLWRVADALNQRREMLEALNERVLVAAVGPVCAEALHAAGVEPDIIPAHPTMESMIAALADYVDLMRDLPD